MSRARDENRVLARRRELGIHILVLANRAHKSAGLISMVEGGYVPKLPTMQKIAVALQTTPRALWPDEFVEGDWCGCDVWCGEGCGFQKPQADAA